jgi:hypothetical protein
MSRLAQALRGASEERGAVLVMVVLWLPVLLIFFMFVADVGNWFVHRRHLQMQTDAGALAGGSVFRIPCTDDPILAGTRTYAGDPGVGGAYNTQIPPTDPGNVHILINSTQYWNEGGTDFSDGGSPCTTKFVDVKATEANLPWFMRVAFVPAIQAHARVSLLQKTSASGSLPIAVPDVRPRDGAAFIVDESTGTILARERLTNEGAATLNGASLTKWDATLPSFDSTGVRNLGVVFALSGTTGMSISGTLAAVCGQALVICYSNNGSSGLVFMHGYSSSATGTATTPVVKNLGLFTAGGAPCGDTSSPSFILNGGCTLGVRAQIDWGTGATPPAAADVRVANLGCPNSGNPKGCLMTYNTTGPNAGYWVTQTSGQYPTFASGSGALAVDFNWQTGTGGSRIGGTITGASRVFSANPAATISGPIQFAQSIVDGAIGPSSVAYGTHTASVAIGVAGNLENASKFSDPTVLLRVADPSGSQNYAIDCDSGRTFRDEIASGCQTTYQKNTGQACPNSVVPLNCAAIETGDKVGQMRQGMNDRFASCPANNWTNPGDPSQFPNIQPGDPRAIPIILVPFGSFKSSGGGWVPVVDFGTFYVTGWDYVGGNAPCSDNEPFPGPGTDMRGDLWGHFIKYVDSINTGGTGDLCDFGSFGTCVAVLTE